MPEAMSETGKNKRRKREREKSEGERDGSAQVSE